MKSCPYLLKTDTKIHGNGLVSLISSIVTKAPKNKELCLLASSKYFIYIFGIIAIGLVLESSFGFGVGNFGSSTCFLCYV
jgi:hypothetical protein